MRLEPPQCLAAAGSAHLWHIRHVLISLAVGGPSGASLQVLGQDVRRRSSEAVKHLQQPPPVSCHCTACPRA